MSIAVHGGLASADACGASTERADTHQTMAMIADNIRQVRTRIADACALADRPVESVTLLVVSKTFSAEAVCEAHSAGQIRFGENYVQEAVEKMAALGDLRTSLEWHLIGPLQSNKTRVVAEQFDWVHTVDRLKIAERLAQQRPENMPPLQVCLQVNISDEASKHGLQLNEVEALCKAVMRLPRLRLRGLMANSTSDRRPSFTAAGIQGAARFAAAASTRWLCA